MKHRQWLFALVLMVTLLVAGCSARGVGGSTTVVKEGNLVTVTLNSVSADGNWYTVSVSSTSCNATLTISPQLEAPDRCNVSLDARKDFLGPKVVVW